MNTSTQLETKRASLRSGSEVAHHSTAAPLAKETATAAKPKRGLPRAHADYWRPRLFRRTYERDGRQHEINDLYIRLQHGGRREFMPLNTTNKDAAAKLAASIYSHLTSNGWESTLAKYRPDAEGQPKLEATIGDYLAAVDATRKLRGRTFLNYRNCLRTIAAEVFGIRPKKGENKFDYRAGGNKAWTARIDEIRLERLTAARVTKWKRDRLAAAGRAPAALAAARRTINSYIRCARSLFAKDVRHEVKSIKLPDPLPFAGVELEESGSMKYVSKIKVHTLIAAARRELRAADPEAYKAFLLGLFAAMRKAEIDSVEWSAVDFAANVIHLEETEWLHLKTHDSAAEISVDAEVIAELRALMPPPTSEAAPWSQFILQSNRAPKPDSMRPYYRCEETFERLNVWLRRYGIRANKPLHELRKEVGAVIATEQGIYAASKFLRHSDITTTARHYADQKARINVGLGKFLNTEIQPAPTAAVHAGKAVKP